MVVVCLGGRFDEDCVCVFRTRAAVNALVEVAGGCAEEIEVKFLADSHM